MATRKSLVLISGLTQELNSSSDKLDFAGNSTSDLSEGTNQYFTNARSRGALSVASGSGLTYNSTSGELSTNAIPNAQLANSALTIGGTSVSLGATQTTFTGLSSLASTTLIAGTEDAANSIEIGSGNITFEGSTADGNETILTATDATGGDKTITLPNNSGTVALTSDIVYPVTLTNTVTLTNKTLALGSNTISGTLAQFNTAVTDATLVSTTGSETLTNKSINLANNTLTGTFAQFNSAVSNATLVSTTGTETLTNKSLTAPVLTGSSSSAGSIIFKEDTDNGTNSVTLKGAASTSDVTITLPAETGTVLTTASSIANSNLANSSITIGSTGVALGGSATSFTGLASITSTAVVTNDSGFRIRNNSDNTKIGAFSSASISAGQTRTLTFPDASGTIATQAYVNSQISAEDLDVQTDSGNIDVDLNSEALILTGGTGIDTSATGTTVTYSIDSTVATLTGSQTLTNKTLTSPVLNTGLSGSAFLDEDNMASNSATKVASQQSIKAYVDNEIAGISADITAVNAGTGLSGGGSSGAVTLAIDSTVATLTGSQTLTNKTFTSAVLNGTISGTSIKDEDNMASDSASHLATQQSIKSYVDTEIAGVPQGDITAVTAGTGLSGGGTTGAVSLAIDATVATLTGSQTLTNKTIDVDNNTISNIEVDNLKSGVLDTDLSSVSGSDNTLASAKAIKSYVDSQAAGITGVTAGDGLTGGGSSGTVTLNVVGGTGITANANDIAIDNTVATLTGTQTLTNKTLTSPTISSPSITGDISGTGNLILTSTDAGSSAAPEFELYRNSASPADADYLGQVKFTGESDDGSKEVYAKFTGKIDDASSGTEDGLIEFAHRKAGSNVITGRFKSTEFQLLNGTGLSVAGNISTDGNLTISNAEPKLFLTDTNNDSDFSIENTNGVFKIIDQTNNATRFQIASGGTVVGSFGNLEVSGNVVVTGNVDGRDVSADGTKLDGIESGATADQTKSDIDALGIAASTAATLATARTIAGVSFDGSANISLNNNAITNGAGYLTSVGTSNITDDAVTYAKIQNVSATNRILGRDSSGAGAIEEITPANLRTMINVEDGADVTDATNVNAAGAVMNSDTSTSAMQFVVDEDNMSSDSATKVPTQQSVKAYVDSQAGATEFADNVFRVKDNSDATKKLAFECSGISGSTTRTLTVPDSNGTIGTEDFATAIAVALG